MTDIAIRVENLSKQYRIGGPQARYKTLRESLTEAVQAPFRRLASVRRRPPCADERDRPLVAFGQFAADVEYRRLIERLLQPSRIRLFMPAQGLHAEPLQLLQLRIR